MGLSGLLRGDAVVADRLAGGRRFGLQALIVGVEEGEGPLPSAGSARSRKFCACPGSGRQAPALRQVSASSEEDRFAHRKATPQLSAAEWPFGLNRR